MFFVSFVVFFSASIFFSEVFSFAILEWKLNERVAKEEQTNQGKIYCQICDYSVKNILIYFNVRKIRVIDFCNGF